MKRFAGMWVLLAALSAGTARAQDMGMGGRCATGIVPTIPGVQGPWGAPVPVATPYMQAPRTESAARAMMAQSVPLEFVQGAGGMPGGMMPAAYPAGGAAPAMMASNGMVAPPGVPGGPGMAPPVNPGMPPPGAVAAVGALTGGMPQRFPTKRSSVRFVSPTGMKIAWYAPTADGKAGFTNTQREVPGRYNFVQGAIYRLKLSDIPNRPGLELYPTLEVVPSNAKSDPFLAHSSVPITFTDEDFNQVADGNYVVKVIYLPDPQFQDVAAANQPGELVSTLLEPGVDPIAEAHRRGNILLVVRMGNIDLETPDTPAMDAPCPYPPRVPMPPAPAMPNRMMMPYGMGGQPRPIMGPDGSLMMMGPNGQPLAMPHPMMMGNPATQPGAMLPPANQVPSMPPMMAPQGMPPAMMPTTPPPAVQGSASTPQPVQYTVMPAPAPTATPAAMAGQEVITDSAPPAKPTKTRRWFGR